MKVVGLQDTAYLKWNPTKMLYQKIDEGVVCNIEISKKKLSRWYERKSAFQTIAIELCKQKQKNWKKNTQD